MELDAVLEQTLNNLKVEKELAAGIKLLELLEAVNDTSDYHVSGCGGAYPRVIQMVLTMILLTPSSV